MEKSRIGNITGTMCGTLSREEIQKLIVDTDDKKLKEKLLRWLEWANPTLEVSEPYSIFLWYEGVTDKK